MISHLHQVLVRSRPLDLVLSSALCVALPLTISHSSSAQVFSCDELRPIRGSEVALEGDLKAEAGFIAKRIIGGEVDLTGKYTLKEVFPEVFGGQDLFDIERFYYTLCLALSDGAIDPERRFTMFMQANRERQGTLRDAFNEQIVSNDPEKQINAIDWAESKGGSLQAQAIEIGLQSNSASVQAAAVEAAIGTSDVIAGKVIAGDSDSVASFSISITERQKVGNAMNFAGQFQGGVFKMTRQSEQAQAMENYPETARMIIPLY
jgi:hypothetical protein